MFYFTLKWLGTLFSHPFCSLKHKQTNKPPPPTITHHSPQEYGSRKSFNKEFKGWGGRGRGFNLPNTTKNVKKYIFFSFWSQTYFLCLPIHFKKLLRQTRWQSDVPRMFMVKNKLCHFPFFCFLFFAFTKGKVYIPVFWKEILQGIQKRKDWQRFRPKFCKMKVVWRLIYKIFVKYWQKLILMSIFC